MVANNPPTYAILIRSLWIIGSLP